MVADHLPLYAIRAYVDLYVDDQGFKIIQTHYRKYVLDNEDLEGNYWERRVKMLDMILPFKLYSIKKRYENVSQLIANKDKNFIDENGNLFKYTPSRYCKLKTNPISVRWQARNGDTMYRVKGCSHTFRTKESSDKEYFTYVQDGVKFYPYGLSDCALKTRRKKI